MRQNIEWFKNNIGKTIFRMPTQKKDELKLIEINVIDKEHANYLMSSQDELGIIYWGEHEKIIRSDTGGNYIIRCPLCEETHPFEKHRWKVEYNNGLPTISPSIYAKGNIKPCHFTVKNGSFTNDKKYWLYGW